MRIFGSPAHFNSRWNVSCSFQRWIGVSYRVVDASPQGLPTHTLSAFASSRSRFWISLRRSNDETAWGKSGRVALL